MARALAGTGVESRLYRKASDLAADMASLDVVIAVKQLPVGLIDICVAASERGVPVFLDLCDDVLSAEYRRRLRDLNVAVFRAVAPMLEAVVVTCDELAARLRSYDVATCPIVVIPDIAEDRAALRAARDFAEQQGLPGSEHREPALPEDAPVMARRKVSARCPGRVVWFGNHGAPHSNFGMLSLLAAAPALRAAYDRAPFELVVVSNHQTKFERFLTRLGVPVIYRAWSAEAVYEELDAADVALLTSGDDRFSMVKSANRALQALMAGKPVVATPTPALRELGSSIWCGDVAEGLVTYLTDPASAEAAVTRGQAVIEQRFSPRALGQSWLGLVGQALGRRRARRQPRAQDRVRRLLFMIEGRADLKLLAPLIDDAQAGRLEAMIVTTDEGSADPAALAGYLLSTNIVPTMATMSQLEEMDARWLRAADVVVLAGDQPAGRLLKALAARNGVRVLSIPGDKPGRPKRTAAENLDLLRKQIGDRAPGVPIGPEVLASGSPMDAQGLPA